MPKPDNTLTTSRRAALSGLLAGAATAVVAIPAAASDGADAELIRNCAVLVAMERKWQNSGDEDGNFPDQPAEYDDLVDAVSDTPALTDAGNRAKLAFAVAFFQDGLGAGSFVDDMAWDAMKALAMPEATLERFARAEVHA